MIQVGNTEHIYNCTHGIGLLIEFSQTNLTATFWINTKILNIKKYIVC